MRAEHNLLLVMPMKHLNFVLEPCKVSISDFKVVISQTPIIGSQVHRVGVISHRSEVFDNLLPNPIALNELRLHGGRLDVVGLYEQETDIPLRPDPGQL